MDTERIYVDNQLFLGRVEEQKQWRAALKEVLHPPHGEDLPYIFLLYGDGGIGKTTLAKRFRDIARDEPPFESAFQILWIDWEDERRRTARLRVGREHISPETVFDIIHERAVAQNWGGDFGAYQKAVKERAEAEKKVAAALEASGERDEFAALRSAGAGAIARILRLRLPIGETGENLARAFLEVGIRVGAEQAAQLRTALERRLRARLDPKQYEIFLNPNQQLARALAEGLKKVAARKPLILFLDTYEIVDRADIWLHEVMRAAGPRLVWVISGRDDLVRSRQFGAESFKGYADEFPRRLVARDLLQLAQQDVRAIFADVAPARPLDDAALAAFTRATRGIPLAIHEAAEMWRSGIALEEIIGEIDDATPRGQIVQKMTARYFLHAPEADQPALWALALARGDVEILRAMLRPADEAIFDLDGLLQRLERDYASVHYERARLHDDPAFFLREHLKSELHRSDDRVQLLNWRAAEVLRARLEKLQADLPRLEDRCADEDWVKTAVDLCDSLFWLDESEAWHWLIPRLVESLAYSRPLRRGLAQTAQSWEECLSAAGKKRVKVLREVEGWFFSSHGVQADLPDELRLLMEKLGYLQEKQAELLDELTRLERLRYLQGEGESERSAILDWQRGKLLYARGKYTEALAMYERAERGLPKDGEALKKQLGEALYDLAGEFLWPQHRRDAIYSAEAERILPKVVEWLPEKQGAWYRLGVALYLGEKHDAALAAYQRAIELDPKLAAPHNGIGNVQSDLGNYEAALAAYRRAIELDPKYAHPHNGIGNVHYQLGNYEAALAAYQRAIELDPKYAHPHNGIGNVHYQLGNYEAALAAYQRAIELDPKDAHPHNGIGNVHYQLGNYEAALAAYQRAIELDPKDAHPHNGIGNVHYQLGNYEAALAAYQRAIELDPKDAHPHNGIGNVQHDLGNDEAALAAYQRAIELGGLSNHELAVVHNGIGNVQAQLGNYEAALAAYQRAIELDPKAAVPHNGLGNVHHQLGNDEAALAAYQRAIELDPKDASPHYGIGNVHQLLGEYEKALTAYQKAVELAPERGVYRAPLASVLRKLGRETEAQEQIQIARGLIAKENKYNRACFEAICGNVEEALALLKVALEKKQAPLEWARRDPDFESIRDDARFQALVAAG